MHHNIKDEHLAYVMKAAAGRLIYMIYLQRRCEQLRKSQESYSEWLYKKRRQQQEQYRRGPTK